MDFLANVIGTRALALLVILLLLVSTTLGIALRIQSAQLDAATAKNGTQAVQLKALGDQVAAQNAAVDQLLANAAIATEQFHQAIIAAGKVRVVTRERVEYVKQAAIPTACPEAVAWGATHAIAIGKRWEAP